MIALFDFDGTIAETGPTIAECLALSIEKNLRRRPDMTAIAAAIPSGALLSGLFEKLVGPLSPQSMAALTADYLAVYPQVDRRLTQLFDGIGDLLEQLQTAGIGLAVVTNKPQAAADDSLAHFKLDLFFPLVVGAEAGSPAKPDPALFDERIRPAFPDRPRQDFIMIGDTATDIRFAKACGLRSIWVSYGHGVATDCQALMPDIIVKDVSGLSDALRRLQARDGTPHAPVPQQ